MINYETLKILLLDLGFTKEKITPLIVLGFVIWLSMRPTRKLVKTIDEFLIRFCGAIRSNGNVKNIKLYKEDTNPLYNQNSPLNLTEEGYQKIKELGFQQAIDNNLGKLFKFIERLKPKTFLDVEQISIGLIRYLMISKEIEIFNQVESFLYNNPKYNRDRYFIAAGLYLRDKYLSTHSKIKDEKTSK